MMLAFGSIANTLTARKSIRAARPDGAPTYVIQDNLSAHKGADIRRWAKEHKAELCFTPTCVSWAMPPIKAHFGPLRQFTVANFAPQPHGADPCPAPLPALAERQRPPPRPAMRRRGRGAERGRCRQAQPLVRTYTTAVNTALSSHGAVPPPCGRAANDGSNGATSSQSSSGTSRPR